MLGIYIQMFQIGIINSVRGSVKKTTVEQFWWKKTSSSPIKFRFETGQTCFLKCNLFWMGGHLSIHAVVYPSKWFYISKHWWAYLRLSQFASWHSWHTLMSIDCIVILISYWDSIFSAAAVQFLFGSKKFTNNINPHSGECVTTRLRCISIEYKHTDWMW